MYKIITEGGTRLYVPVEGSFGKRLSGRFRKAPVFYNPHMALNRGLTVLFLRALEVGVFGDVLAGSGAKGLRAAKEAGWSVHLNDANKYAVGFLERNALLNDVDASISCLDANRFLAENWGVFDFIDLDPFGTPAPFAEAALQALGKKGGFLGMTATDTATLCGVYPRVCRRRYGAVSLRAPICHEVGMRILMGFLVRSAAKYDLAAKPVFAHSTRHYLRVYVKVAKGARAADGFLGDMGFVYWCGACRDFDFEKGVFPNVRTCGCGAKMLVSGPLWLGGLYDLGIVGEMLKFSPESVERSLLEVISREIEAPFYHDVHALSKRVGSSSPPINKVIESLRERGFRASRTHFNPLGVKTEARAGDLLKAFS